ncbi:hypothetical protein [Xanthobacter autotrophicus]|uniref:hypothetical protein n=1 Tax=Xanthobacter autotrophicus TaxID=280 RepID=UPI00372AB234
MVIERALAGSMPAEFRAHPEPLNRMFRPDAILALPAGTRRILARIVGRWPGIAVEASI